MSQTAQCGHCLHYIGATDDRPDVSTCLAFPDGIPIGILKGEIDHSKPVEGDNGIRFEPRNPAWKE